MEKNRLATLEEGIAMTDGYYAPDTGHVCPAGITDHRGQHCTHAPSTRTEERPCGATCP